MGVGKRNSPSVSGDQQSSRRGLERLSPNDFMTDEQLNELLRAEDPPVPTSPDEDIPPSEERTPTQATDHMTDAQFDGLSYDDLLEINGGAQQKRATDKQISA